MIPRQLEPVLVGKLFSGKAIILTGPRQVGKTTLIRTVLQQYDSYLFLDGDDPSVRKLLDQPNTEELRRLIGSHRLIFIDEAQRINHIGITLKIIVDQFKSVQLLVSGSSAFELNQTMNESLTGRKWEYSLYPVSWGEWENYKGYLVAQQQLTTRLVYGMYPDVLNHQGEEEEILRQLTDSYLYKDILSFGRVKKPDLLEKLLQALAYQVGSEVSYNELAQLTGMDKETVSVYIQLLEQAFVIFRLSAFSRNLRNEIKTNRKIYFYDNGIRNALINNFNPFDGRTDKGALWENFLISERKKANMYARRFVNSYFWRTKQQQEVDYLEERNGHIAAFEFKWSSTKKVKFPDSFVAAYQPENQVIHAENFRDFLSFPHVTE